jgi:hypothetical protein
MAAYSKKVIFTYSIVHLEKKDKIRFYYALKGRDGKSGIAKKCSIEQLGRAVLLVPAKSEKEITGFLEYWKCKFKKMNALIERRMKK